jgi:uncharacterized protein DUF6289
MQRVGSFLKSRGSRLAIVVMVLGSALGLASPVKVHSFTCQWRPIIRDYWSDATHTTLVGQRGLNCNCDDISWGVTSSYLTQEVQCCPFFTC